MRKVVILSATELLKSKYTRRWKGPDGKWRYEYGSKKGDKPGLSVPEGSEGDFLNRNQGKTFSLGGKKWKVGEEHTGKVYPWGKEGPSHSADIVTVGPSSTPGKIVAMVSYSSGGKTESDYLDLSPDSVSGVKPIIRPER